MIQMQLLIYSIMIKTNTMEPNYKINYEMNNLYKHNQLITQINHSFLITFININKFNKLKTSNKNMKKRKSKNNRVILSLHMYLNKAIIPIRNSSRMVMIKAIRTRVLIKNSNKHKMKKSK